MGQYALLGLWRLPRKLEDAYLLVEYVYVDKPEASQVRLADIQVPIVTHVAVPVVDTQGSMGAQVPVRIGNPVRNLFWMAQRTDASKYNDHFSCSRELLDFREGVTGGQTRAGCRQMHLGP